jgi:alpha-tubulin suppressor-like RCC1 family protein
MPLQIMRPPRSARRGPVLLAAGLTAALAAPAAASAEASSAHAGQAAAMGGNAIVAWGFNFHGEMGNGTTASSSEPVRAQVPGTFRYTTVRSAATSVALTTTGRVYGWGSNTNGQIGDGTQTSRLTPVRATELAGVKVTALRENGAFTMALTSTGKVLSFGINGDGELGDGTTISRLTPVRARIPKGVTITAISAGSNSALALTKSGRVLAWGANGVGQLGDGTTKDRHTPVYVRLPRHTKITSIALGFGAGYAITSAGRLMAWGYNSAGQLGDGTTKNRKTPVRVRLPRGVKAAAATAGEFHALALTADGRALAWGYNAFGQLGNGTTTSRHMPAWVRLPAGARVRALAAGLDFSMALTRTGRILTWGHDNVGQLGNGTTTDSATPVRVHLPFGFAPTAIGAGWEAETGLAIGNQTN